MNQPKLDKNRYSVSFIFDFGIVNDVDGVLNSFLTSEIQWMP